jgi:hypothetical protein
MRLSSFLYGMFFLNANINAELSIHVSNMKCLVDAYHALVSLLMSKKLNYDCNKRDNMSLFMLMAHYVQQPTLTNYRHARNAIKKSFSKFFLVIVVRNIANAINVLVGLLIQIIHCKKASQSQRITLWDQMK